MTSPVLVTGGTGRLGKLVVARLQDSGCDVRVLARHRRPIPRGAEFFTADLRTGRGIKPAVTSAAAIIHCATGTRGDAEATRNLGTAASLAGSGHLVYVSIVGIDRIASWGYPKTKLQAEQIVASSGLPWTILRVTQFYDYCLANARKLSRVPWCQCQRASPSSQSIPATWRPGSSSWRWASQPAARRTWPARR
jgi:uncharacterized protein YbjT (DUF2867 family)